MALAWYPVTNPAYSQGFIVRLTGIVDPNAGWRYFMLPVNPLATRYRVSVTLTAASNVTALAVYYDAAGVLLGHQFPNMAGSNVYTNQVLTLPAGTATIGFCEPIAASAHVIEMERDVAPNIQSSQVTFAIPTAAASTDLRAAQIAIVSVSFEPTFAAWVNQSSLAIVAPQKEVPGITFVSQIAIVICCQELPWVPIRSPISLPKYLFSASPYYVKR